MKGHLEIFEHRLKDMAQKLPGAQNLDMEQTFLQFEQALGTEIPIMMSITARPWQIITRPTLCSLLKIN